MRMPRFSAWAPLFAAWDTELARQGLRGLEACLGFTLGRREVDRVVVGVDAKDGLFYKPQTTLAGIVQKHTGTGDFNAPQVQLDAIQALRAQVEQATPRGRHQHHGRAGAGHDAPGGGVRDLDAQQRRERVRPAADAGAGHVRVVQHVVHRIDAQLRGELAEHARPVGDEGEPLGVPGVGALLERVAGDRAARAGARDADGGVAGGGRRGDDLLAARGRKDDHRRDDFRRCRLSPGDAAVGGDREIYGAIAGAGCSSRDRDPVSFR